MKRRRATVSLLRFAFLCAGTILLQSSPHCQVGPEPRTLSGNVYYAGGNQPAENVSVELHSSEGSLIALQATTATGWFEFRGLKRDVYTIVINVDGFEPLNFNVDLALSSSRGNAIYLKSRSSAPQKPPIDSVSAHELSMPQRARDLMESGKKKLYKDKDAKGALADFQEAVTSASDYYEAYYQIAMACLVLDRRDNAEENLKKAIEISSDKYGDAEIGLGTMMLDKGDFAEGEKIIRHGIEVSPRAWLGHYELARALLNENQIEKAERSALEAQSLAPNAAIIYRLLSNVHLRERKYSALLEDIDAYLKLDSDSPAATRAKQIREEIQRKIAEDKPAQSTNPKP